MKRLAILCLIVETFNLSYAECLALRETAANEGSRLECDESGSHRAYTKLGEESRAYEGEER